MRKWWCVAKFGLGWLANLNANLKLPPPCHHQSWARFHCLEYHQLFYGTRSRDFSSSGLTSAGKSELSNSWPKWKVQAWGTEHCCHQLSLLALFQIQLPPNPFVCLQTPMPATQPHERRFISSSISVVSELVIHQSKVDCHGQRLCWRDKVMHSSLDKELFSFCLSQSWQIKRPLCLDFLSAATYGSFNSL